jgi:crossover junction endodeoxyribonuclease RuvC
MPVLDTLEVAVLDRLRSQELLWEYIEMRNDVVVGFDPGTARLGYGVVAGTDEPQAIDFGVLETSSSEPMAVRLKQLYDGVCDILRRYHPPVCAIEQLFFSRNVTTALSVGQARGIVMLAAAQSQISVEEYTPAEVKQAVSGYGKADKSQMQEMVRLILGLPEIPYPDDAADALAVALCHLQTARFRKAIGE